MLGLPSTAPPQLSAIQYLAGALATDARPMTAGGWGLGEETEVSSWTY